MVCWHSHFGSRLMRRPIAEAMELAPEAIGASPPNGLCSKSGRTAERQGYRSEYYGRTSITRVGKLELRVPQDRQGRFRTEVFERCQRSEKALVGALAEMYVQGVSTRKVKAITEEELEKFARRQREEAYPYLLLDARYQKVRQDAVIQSHAVMFAIGINEDGRRCVTSGGRLVNQSAPNYI